MLTLTIILLLAAVTDQSLGEAEEKEEENAKEIQDDLSKGSDVSLKIQQVIVDKHNEMRRNVKPTARNMLKMNWNETIGEDSRKWAEKCLTTPNREKPWMFDGVFCGQSVYQTNAVATWSEILDLWYNKRNDFKYGVGAVNPQKNIYSYTQAIWYRSYQIGCAVSHCPKSKFAFTYLCQYCPIGNIAGQIAKPYKEGPPCGDCPNHCDNGLCTNPCKHMDYVRSCARLKSAMGCKIANKDGQCKATCKCKTKIK